MSQGGVDYLVVQGTTGESATTTTDEKKKIIETIKESNAQNLPIVYGIGGNNTESLLGQIKNTKELEQMQLVKLQRLSVSAVTEEEFNIILDLSSTKL